MNKVAWLTILASWVALPLAAGEPQRAPPTQLEPVVITGKAQPVPRRRINPPYPMQAKHRWEQGCVVLQFTIRPDGKTDDFAILESKPPGVFEKSVINAVYRWEYDRSPESRTVVETFEFRNKGLGTQPLYTVRNAVKVPIGHDASGGRRYRLEMQLQGYQPPKCKRS